MSTWPVRVSSAMLSAPPHSRTTMNNVVPDAPPSTHAKQPASSSIVASTSPPSLTLTQRLCGTSPYQTAPSASMQMPSGLSPPRSAQTRPSDSVPSGAISNAVSLLPTDSAQIKVELSGATAIPLGKATPPATRTGDAPGLSNAIDPGEKSPPGNS